MPSGAESALTGTFCGSSGSEDFKSTPFGVSVSAGGFENSLLMTGELPSALRLTDRKAMAGMAVIAAAVSNSCFFLMSNYLLWLCLVVRDYAGQCRENMLHTAKINFSAILKNNLC